MSEQQSIRDTKRFGENLARVLELSDDETIAAHELANRMVGVMLASGQCRQICEFAVAMIMKSLASQDEHGLSGPRR